VGFDIKVTGLNESVKLIDDIVKGISNDVNSMIEKIIKTAKEICNDPDCKRIKRKGSTAEGREILVNLEFADKGAIDCMIQAIKKYLDTMPDGVKQIFETEIKRLEEMKKEN